MGKRLASAGVAAAIVVGGLGVAVVNPLGVAGANPAGPTATMSSPAPAAKIAPNGAMARALRKLVINKTLTQAQADKVGTSVRAELGALLTAKAQLRQSVLATVATTIHSTPSKILVGLKGGLSIAVQAQGAGVSRQTVFDALNTMLTAHLDQAVKTGDITQAQHDANIANLSRYINRVLDATAPGVVAPATTTTTTSTTAPASSSTTSTTAVGG